MKLLPVGSLVLIRLMDQQKETKTGLVVVRKKEEWQEETLLATVIAIGPDVNIDISENDTVIVPGHAGKWIDPQLVDGTDRVHRIVHMEDLLAVIEPTDEPTAQPEQLNLSMEAA